MDKSYTQTIKEFFNTVAAKRDEWKNKNFYYHNEIANLCKFLIPSQKKVLDIGCGTGDLLESVSPSFGVGIDISEKMIDIAKEKHPNLKFHTCDAQNITINDKFDYVILSDLIGNLEDIQKTFEELKKVSDEKTRIIITCYNYLWEPILTIGEKVGMKMPQPLQNWLSSKDIENFFNISNLDIVKKSALLLFPKPLPLISTIFNKFLARLPLMDNLCLVQYFVARQKPSNYSDKEYSVSVVIPSRNEEGNIEKAVLRTPKLGSSTELIFVEGHSKDNTLSEIKRVINKYKGKKDIKLILQGKGVGKADAVRKGFAKAKGDILMILDADLTVAPEELPKFYQVLRTGKAEYVQGTRLVYAMEKEAMRILNVVGNKLFSLTFSWLLGQPIKDTLCGTKALFKSDYERIAKNRSYFGDFDPFGDFDLIFGASKLNLKIMEIPIRYKARTYGTSNISRFRHGLLLLKMTYFAAKKLKFI